MKSTLTFILIITGCFCIAFMTNGMAGMLALLLCFASFLFGVNAHAYIVINKAKNGELLECGEKYYEVKYVKDKIK